MSNRAPQNKPPYAITSVDHALLLAILLQHEGPLRVSEAAARLDVSVSTAHRLLAMLVYRGFAEQCTDRRYRAGRLLSPVPPTDAPVARLREVADEPLRHLATHTGETASLVVLAGREIRFVTTIESRQVLRVGDRAGRTLPAHLSSAGKAILAASEAEEVTALYAEEPEVDLVALRRQLSLVRSRGFAINDQKTEPGVTALAVAVPGASAAVALAMPTSRFHRDHLAGWVRALGVTARRIGGAVPTP